MLMNNNGMDNMTNEEIESLRNKDLDEMIEDDIHVLIDRNEQLEEVIQVLRNESEEIPYEQAGELYGYPIQLRMDLSLQMEKDCGINENDEEYNTFLFEALQDYIHMKELAEAEFYGLPAPDIRVSHGQIKEGLQKFAADNLQAVSTFVNDALENYLNVMEWVQTQPEAQA